MNKIEIMEALKGNLVVSCQALPGEPLHSSFIMRRLAYAAYLGGAKGIRANSVEDIKEIKRNVNLPHQLFMADCSTFTEAETAEALGFDFLGTTLAGYTDYTKERQLPDISLMEEIVEKLHTPLIAEGGISTPEELEVVMNSGAFCAVVGSAITRPLEITKRFVEAVKK